jgi:hypothetical protein
MCRSADSFWSGAGKKPLIVRELHALLKKAEKGTAGNCAAKVLAALDSLLEKVVGSSHPCGGLCIIVDEMGKLLEYAVQHPEKDDVYFYQKLAEKVQRAEDGATCLLGILHQDFAQYSQGLPRTVRTEWEKVAGRFQPHAFLESPQHLLELTGGAIHASDKARALALWKRGTKFSRDVSKLLKDWSNARGIPRQLEKCFPLHPLTALCLGPLFRQRLGQNERSIFAFLTAKAPGGFQAYLNATEAHTAEPYSLEQLYDYLLSSLGAHSLAATGERLWLAAEEAMVRLPEDSTSLDVRLIKSVVILTLVSVSLPIRADAPTLSLALDEPLSGVRSSLRRLQGASILVYRKFRDSYQIWDGSDLDVGSLVEKGRRRVLSHGRLAEQLQKHFPPEPVIASRHYYETGTLRYLVPRYVSVGGVGRAETADGDGDLLYVLSDQPHSKKKEEAFLPVASGRRLEAWVYPQHRRALYEAVLEFLGTVEALASTPELADDPVARRALAERRSDAERAMVRALEVSFRGPTTDWIVGKERYQVRQRPSTAASKMFDQTYPSAPHIHNELVNRRELSSQAAKAQRLLLERMITDAEKDRLGIEGHPPELSMYRSILESHGLHRKYSGVRGFSNPPRNSRQGSCQAAWECIDSVLGQSLGTRVSISELTQRLSKPPYGIRPSVSSVLLLSYYLAHREGVFLYDEGTFQPQVGPEFAFRLLKDAGKIELQQVEKTGITRQVVKALSAELGLNTESLLTVVRHLINVGLRISSYAMQTQDLSRETSRVRSSLRSARDPSQLILTELPSALGCGDLTAVKRSANVSTYGKALQAAMEELTSCDEKLEQEVERAIRKLLGAEVYDPGFPGELVSRCEALKDSPALSDSAKRFVSVTRASDPRVDKRSWRRSVAQLILGKPSSGWDDSDLSRFLHESMKMVGSFLGAEQLSLELHQRNDHETKLIRVSVLDSQGKESTGVAVLRASQQKELVKFCKRVERLAADVGIESREAAYLVISEMLEIAEGRPTSKDAKSGAEGAA